MNLSTNTPKAILLASAFTLLAGSTYAASYFTASGIVEMGSAENFGGVNNTAESVIFEVNFDYNSDATTGTPLLWEVGGNTIGAALWLDGANISYEVNGTVFTDAHGLSVTDPVSSVQVVAVLDLDLDFQELYVNGLSLGTIGSTSNDWAGGNSSGLGRQGGGQTGGSTSNTTQYPLGAGEEITFAAYLLSENSVESILVPEPSAMMLIGFGGVLALLRRRR